MKHFSYNIHDLDYQISFIPKPVWDQSTAPYLSTNVFLCKDYIGCTFFSIRITKRIRFAFGLTSSTRMWQLGKLQAEW